MKNFSHISQNCNLLTGKEYIASRFCSAYWYHLQKIYQQLKEGYISCQHIPPHWCLDFQEFIKCTVMEFSLKQKAPLFWPHRTINNSISLYINFPPFLASAISNTINLPKSKLWHIFLYIFPLSMYVYDPHTNIHIHKHKTCQWIAEFTGRQEKTSIFRNRRKLTLNYKLYSLAIRHILHFVLLSLFCFYDYDILFLHTYLLGR